MPTSLGSFVRSLVLCAACAALAPPSAYGQSLKEQLSGAWTLVSWTRVVGETEEPGLMGQDAIGQIMFAGDGHMCFNAMRRNRPPFASPEFQRGTPEEKAAAYDGYVGYCGRYEVNEQERSVIFRLELSSYPNLTGTAQKRFVEIAGNRLKIKSPPIPVRGTLAVNTVVWERAK